MIRSTFFLLILLFAASNTYSKPPYIQTAYAADGINVHLVYVSAVNNVLTIAFMVENPTEQDVAFPSMNVKNVFYVADNKKYPVLLDIEEKYLVSTISYDRFSGGTLFSSREKSSHSITIDKGQYKIGWAKFELPKQWPVEISMPGITPFTIQQPE